MSKTFTAEELATLNKRENLHLLIAGKVYDCHAFADEHPGGDEVLLNEAGKDATEAFEDVGHSDEAREILAGLLVGVGEAPKGHGASAASSASGAVKSADKGKSDSLAYLVPLAVFVAYLAYRYYSKTA